MLTLVDINMINKHMGLKEWGRNVQTEYYSRRLTNLPRKNKEDQQHSKIRI